MKISNPLSSNPYKDFSETHSLLYSTKFEKDAHDIVRGVTLSTDRKDSDLIQGNLDGLDVQLLSRRVRLQKPGAIKHELFWTILHVTLESKRSLPHVFLDGNNRYHEDVYEHIFTKFHGLILSRLPYDNGFTLQYRVFCNPETIPKLGEILPHTLTDKLSAVGHFFDYELHENNLYVYLAKIATNQKDLDQMVSAAKILKNNLFVI